MFFVTKTFAYIYDVHLTLCVIVCSEFRDDVFFFNVYVSLLCLFV